VTGPPQPNQFDRSKPYYPFVIHYVLTLWAFKELAAHGAGILFRASGADPAGELPPGVDAELIRRVAASPLVEVLPPLDLLLKSDGTHTSVDALELATEIAQNYTYLLDFTLRAASGLLISAYEISKHHRDHGELWEFFRHVRNAAAHGGTFSFKEKEPVRPARWRELEVTRALQGTPLFDGFSYQSGLLGPGDPLRLLWDVERATAQ
jgi:hypothetical protein